MNYISRIVLLLAIFASNVSQATVIDFEGQSAFANTNGSFFDIGGYRFTLTDVNSGFLDVTNQTGLIDDNSTKLFSANHAILTLSRADGGLFDLLSFDIAGSWTQSPNRWASSVDVTSSAGTTSAVLAGQPAAYQTITPGFMGVSSVAFTPNGHIGGSPYDFEFDLDNINVQSSVPEPASLALLAIGLIGFAFVRQRKNV
ncbi:MAG TPA: PEP-CTERM sorting domain-containing protein [Burkholderiaceae bacterium]|jgi:hypothetical protein